MDFTWLGFGQWNNFPYFALQLASYSAYVLREITRQSSLRHPFIVALKEVSLGALLLRTKQISCCPSGILGPKHIGC